MQSRRRQSAARLARPLLLLPGGVVLAGATAAGGLRLLRTVTTPGADPAAAVAGLASLTAAAIATWLSLCLLLVLLAELPGAAGRLTRRLRDQVTPAVVQQWAAVALGASVTATVVPGTAVSATTLRSSEHGAAEGETPTAPAPGWSTSPAAPGPSTLPGPGPGWAPTDNGTSIRAHPGSSPPGWVPRRPPPRQRSDPHLLTGRGRSTPTDEGVVVRRGDSLWSVVAARLGPEATDLEVARAWPRWHAANADVIGDDPHRILPGTRLVPPPPDP